MNAAFAAGCLVAAATVAGWPTRRRVRVQRLARATNAMVPAPATAVLGTIQWRSLAARLGRRNAVPAVAGAGAVLGFLLGGPVASLLAGVYLALAACALGRRERRRAAALARAEMLDALGVLTGELRAGLPPGRISTADAGEAGEADPLSMRITAAVSLAETTGAPLAALLERVETDARAGDRTAAMVAAQSAGAQATAWLLAGLPVAGLALGHAIGADPVRVLLHTPIGAACAIAALCLQVAGLAWSARLARAWTAS